MKRVIKIIIVISLFLCAFYFIFLEYEKIYSRIDLLENSIDGSIDNKISGLHTAYSLLLEWKEAQVNHNQSQNSDIRENAREASILENKISKLENKISKLENRFPKKIDRLTYSEKWLNKSNWRKLRNGMSEIEVVNLLGEPHSRNAPNFIEYEYRNNTYYGVVSISDFSGVKLWKEPNF